jgi:hypothetical protein
MSYKSDEHVFALVLLVNSRSRGLWTITTSENNWAMVGPLLDEWVE